jgi:DNA repair protein RadC
LLFYFAFFVRLAYLHPHIHAVFIVKPTHKVMKHSNTQAVAYRHNQESTWCVEDQPATKLASYGARSLTNTELLATLLNGMKDASEVARHLYANADNNLNILATYSIEQLVNLQGISKKKAVVIHAAIELGRRTVEYVNRPEKIKSSQNVAEIMRPFIGHLQHEEFWLICLNRANTVLGRYKISQGGLSGTVIDTRIILKKSLDCLASSIIVSHNHPSGNTQPSDADIKITEKLKKACDTLEINLLDHVIVTAETHFSLADEGLIQP